VFEIVKPTETDVLIIGAGPAGAVAAASLHRDGYRTIVVEKQHFPRFVIGESLLPRTMDLLKEVGLLDAVEAKNFIHKTGAVFRRGKGICDFDFANQAGDGWKYTYHVPRAEFDKTLADTVEALGVEILYGHGVSEVNFTDEHAEVALDQPDGSKRNISAKFVLDCSGYGRVLPRLLDLEAPSSYPVRESLFTHVTGDKRPTGRDEGKIWICMQKDGAWIWIIPFSNGKTSVGVVGMPEFFAKYPSDPEAQLREILMSEPNTAERLADMQTVFLPQRIKGFACSVKKLFGPQFALAGNATEFLDPVFSSGVTLAMESGLRAAQVTARQLRGEVVNWQADYGDYVMQGVNTFRAYVTAWYDDKFPTILFAAQRNPGVMSQICSGLAGYVWNKANPYVAQADRALRALATISTTASRAPQATASVASETENFFATDEQSAFDAKCEAQRIAFAPVVFQTCRILRDSGVLELVQKSSEHGLALAEIVTACTLPRYGLKVLMESGLGIGLFCLNRDRFTLTKLGYFMLRDPMTRVNMDVIHDICYRGLFDLDKSLTTGKPVGLKTLGDWPTFYEGLSALPPHAQQSWFAFDHYYSDQAFPAALPLVFADKPKTLMDVGGNTGRWALQCLKHDADVRITIADLPRQLDFSRATMKQNGYESRVDFCGVDMLDEKQLLPAGHDAIWMSQLLDCFSEAQIVSILRRASVALGENGRLHIMELFWDRQPNKTAAFCLQQTSLYFTAIANGNSQMYHSKDLLRCLAEAGLEVLEQRDQVGQFHTWLKCKRA